MTLDQFKATLATRSPPQRLALALVALWHDGAGDWDAAHRVAQGPVGGVDDKPY